MTHILETHELTKTYQANGASVLALRGVDLAIQTGEFVAVMGASGSGKSTLLHLLGGLDRPTTGEVHFEGARIDPLSEAKLAVMRRQKIGYLFQFFNLVPNLDGADNVELPALIAGTPAPQARKRRSQLMEALGVDDQRDRLPAQMSGGQRQRVALARALVNEPDVLLVDEPTGNLDTEAADDVLDLLRRSHREGQTIVMVTHDPRVAANAERVVRLRDGQVVSQTTLHAGDTTRVRLSELIDIGVE